MEDIQNKKGRLSAAINRILFLEAQPPASVESELTDLFAEASQLIGKEVGLGPCLLDNILCDCAKIADQDTSGFLRPRLEEFCDRVLLCSRRLPVSHVLNVAAAITAYVARPESKLYTQACNEWERLYEMEEPKLKCHRSSHAAIINREGTVLHQKAVDKFFAEVESKDVSDRIGYYQEIILHETRRGRTETAFFDECLEKWDNSVRKACDRTNCASFGLWVWNASPEGSKTKKVSHQLMIENGYDPASPNPKALATQRLRL